jgi:hypothetical protein
MVGGAALQLVLGGVSPASCMLPKLRCGDNLTLSRREKKLREVLRLRTGSHENPNVTLGDPRRNDSSAEKADLRVDVVYFQRGAVLEAASQMCFSAARLQFGHKDSTAADRGANTIRSWCNVGVSVGVGIG